MSKLDKPFPPSINLRGITYRIAEHEGLIVFSEEEYIAGCQCRFTFEKKAECWYVSGVGDTMVTHIFGAYDLVREYRGGNFGLDE